MNTNGANNGDDTNVSGLSSRLDELEKLLARQIELARKSNYRAVETLAEQVGTLAEEITAAKEFERDEFIEHRERLAKLYSELILIVAAQKDKLGTQLSMVRSGRKTLEAYRSTT